MSFQTHGFLFYGFTTDEDDDHLHDDNHGPVDVTSAGHDSDSTRIVCITAATKTVDLFGPQTKRVEQWNLMIEPAWDPALRAFADRKGLAWPADGAGWHLAVSRF